LAHVLVGEPVSTPDQVRGRLSPGHALMLRVAWVFTAIGAITAALLPFQWLAVKLALPLRRRIPALYHRMVCAILGVRVRVIEARCPSIRC